MRTAGRVLIGDPTWKPRWSPNPRRPLGTGVPRQTRPSQVASSTRRIVAAATVEAHRLGRVTEPSFHLKPDTSEDCGGSKRGPGSEPRARNGDPVFPEWKQTRCARQRRIWSFDGKLPLSSTSTRLKLMNETVKMKTRTDPPTNPEELQVRMSPVRILSPVSFPVSVITKRSSGSGLQCAIGGSRMN